MAKNNEGKKRKIAVKCPRRAFAGLFILTSGIAIWVNLVMYKIFDLVGPEGLAASVQVLATSILIVWILAGIWLLLYGLIYPCPQQSEF